MTPTPTYLLIKTLTQVKVQYIEDKLPRPLDDEFRETVKCINKRLSLTDITYGVFYHHVRKAVYDAVIPLAAKLLDYFHQVDLMRPLNASDFHLYLELSHLTKCLENITLSNEIITDNVQIPLYLRPSDEYLIDKYNSKLECFKNNSNEKSVKMISEQFTYFLLEHVKLLKKIKGVEQIYQPFSGDVPFEKDVNTLVKFGDQEILLKNMHSISDTIPRSKITSLCKRLTSFCIKRDFDLQECKFVQVIDNNFNLEVTLMSYFGLQNICKDLINLGLLQTAEILCMFTHEDIFASMDSNLTHTFKMKYDESYKCITFETEEKIKVLNSYKIKKCLLIVKTLRDSLAHGKLVGLDFLRHPLTPILLSMLHELIMVTNLSNFKDRSNIKYLIDLLIVFVDVSQIPNDFSVTNYAFTIYKRCKSNNELRLKSLELCTCFINQYHTNSMDITMVPLFISLHVGLVKMFEQFLNSDEDIVDKLLVVSYFLMDCKFYSVDNRHLITVIQVFYDKLMLVIKSSTKLDPQLLFPYSVALKYLINSEKKNFLVNNYLLQNFIAILFSEHQTIRLEERSFFLKLIIEHYKILANCIPPNFFEQSFEYILRPQNMNPSISLSLCNLCPADKFEHFINNLKTETIKIIQAKEKIRNEEIYIYEIWSSLLNSPFISKKKSIRKEQIHHFCFILKKTFLFNSRKIKTENGLILLYKIVALLLNVPWIPKTLLTNFTLQIITYAEKRKNIKNVQVLVHAIEVLIVLRKLYSVQESFKPYLGLFLSSIAGLVKTSWSFATRFYYIIKVDDSTLYTTFHKLEICSSLLKEERKEQYSYIIRYTIAELLDMIATKDTLPNSFMKIVNNIVFNMMAVCESDEIKMLKLHVQGPTLPILKEILQEYKSNVRYVGRL